MRARRRGIADLELERLDAAEAAAGEAGDDVDAIALRDLAGELGPAEGDPVEDVEAPLEDELAVAAGGLTGPGHGQSEHGHDGLRVADTGRRQAGELGEQPVVDVGRRQGEIELEGRSRVGRLGLRGEGEETLAEGRPASGLDLEAGRARMPAVADQEVAAGGDRIGEVKPAVATSGDADDRAQVCPDERRATALLGQSTGDETHDAHRPGPMDERRRRVVDGVGRRPGLGEGRLHEVPTGDVGGLEGGRQGLGLGRIVGEQEPRRIERLPYAPGGVQARGQGESDRFDIDRLGRHAGAPQQGGDPGSAADPDPVQAEPDDRPVLAEDRRHVRDGTDRRQVRQRERGGPVPEEEPGEGEGDAGSGQAGVGVHAPGSVGVDDRHGGGELRRDPVVIGDQDVDPAGTGRGDLGDARRPRVDRDDEPGPFPLGGLDGRERQAVALLEAGRHVRDDLDAEGPQGEGQDGEAGDPVGVEVTEDEDPLAAVTGRDDPGMEGGRVGQEGRIVEAGRGRAEVALEGAGGCDPASCEEGHDPRRQAQAGA